MEVHLIEALLFGGVGFALGVYADFRARKEEKEKPPEPDPYYKEPGRIPPGPGKLICGCGHHLSYHDREGGRCRHKRHFFAAGSGKIRYLARCSCQRYVGPEPMPDFLAQEIVKELGP
jgi:hypothetical protein